MTDTTTRFQTYENISFRPLSWEIICWLTLALVVVCPVNQTAWQQAEWEDANSHQNWDQTSVLLSAAVKENKYFRKFECIYAIELALISSLEEGYCEFYDPFFRAEWFFHHNSTAGFSLKSSISYDIRRKFWQKMKLTSFLTFLTKSFRPSLL